MSNRISRDAVQHVRDTCLCFAAQRAARILARRFDNAFRPLGITNTQFSLMMPLTAPEPLTLTKLAAFLGADQTTMTAALKALARAGLISVNADDEDRRVRRAFLTEKGLKTLRAALPIWQREHAALERELPQGSAEALSKNLAAVAASAQLQHFNAFADRANSSKSNRRGRAKGTRTPG